MSEDDLIPLPLPGVALLERVRAADETSERYSILEYSNERIAAQGKVGLDDWKHLACFGLDGESGEVVELVKKHLFHGKPIQPAVFYLELGDVLWYLNFCAANHPDIRSMMAFANCEHFDEFDLGHVALTTDHGILMKMATGHLTVDVGKLTAKLLFNEPWHAGPEETKQHMRGIFWAIAALAHVTGTDLELIAKLNNEKLRERYPHGFSVEAASKLGKDAPL